MNGNSRKERTSFAPILLLLALIVLWIGFRVFPALPHVFPPDKTPRLLGNDPWFHLQQSIWCEENYPKIARWDISTMFPNGTYNDSASLFHLGVATLGKLLFSDPSTEQLTVLIAWSPIFFCVLALLLLYDLVRRISQSTSVALLAVVLAVLLPGESLDRTLLGFADNHALEILLSVAILWSATLILPAPIEEGEISRKQTRNLGVGLLATSLFLLFFSWSGAPLPISTFVLSAAAAHLIAWVRGESISPSLIRFGIAFLAFGTGLALISSLSPEWMMRRSLFGPFLAGSFLSAFFFLATGGALTRFSPPLQSSRRILIAALAILLTVSSILVVLEIFPRAHNLATRIATSNRDQVSENFSLSWQELAFFSGPLILLGLPGLLVAFAKASLLGTRIILLYTAASIFTWILVSDFGYLASFLLPIPAAFTCHYLGRRLSSLLRSGKRLKSISQPLALSALFLVCLFLMGMSLLRPPYLTKHEVAHLRLASDSWIESLQWLREHSSSTPLPVNHAAPPWRPSKGFEYPEGSYGVLSHWQYGNLIPIYAKRYAVSSRYSSGRFLDWTLSNSEQQSLSVLDDIGEVRYLILDSDSLSESFLGEVSLAEESIDRFQIIDQYAELDGVPFAILSYGDRFRNSIGVKLYFGNGSDMSRYRLIYASAGDAFIRYRTRPDFPAVELRSTPISEESYRDQITPLLEPGVSWWEEGLICYSGDTQPEVKIFERVKGAVLRGNAPPGTTVTFKFEAKIPPASRTVVFEHELQADEETGEFRIRLPYATDSGDEDSEVSNFWELRFGDGTTRKISIPEKSVQEGEVIMLK